MNLIQFLALCILTGLSFATWATCEPPQTEPSPYKPLQMKPPSVYRPLVSMTGSKPLETAKSGPTDPRKSPADLAREADNKAYFRELRDKLGAIDVPSVSSNQHTNLRTF